MFDKCFLVIRKVEELQGRYKKEKEEARNFSFELRRFVSSYMDEFRSNIHTKFHKIEMEN